MRDLRPLLAPASVAILGASSRPGTIGGLPLAHLQAQGYAGTIYPVNPARTEVAGLPCYPSVEALPASPELALIVLPTAAVLPAVGQGAGRAGDAGEVAQARLSELARAGGMILCGPNSIGVLNYVDRMSFSFAGPGDIRH